MSAAGPNWRAVNPHMIATTCSPKHIQSVIEDAQRDITQLETEREVLLEALRYYTDAQSPEDTCGGGYYSFMDDGFVARVAIAKVAGGDQVEDVRTVNGQDV